MKPKKTKAESASESRGPDDQSGQPLRKFGKLVRDKIPADLRRKGLHVVTRRLRGAKRSVARRAKLHEEVRELCAVDRSLGRSDDDRCRIAGEIADVLEVLRAIARAHRLEWHVVESRRISKASSRGGLQNGIFLVSTEGVARRRKRLERKRP